MCAQRRTLNVHNKYMSYICLYVTGMWHRPYNTWACAMSSQQAILYLIKRPVQILYCLSAQVEAVTHIKRLL